jgi:hypothetical protein
MRGDFRLTNDGRRIGIDPPRPGQGIRDGIDVLPHIIDDTLQLEVCGANLKAPPFLLVWPLLKSPRSTPWSTPPKSSESWDCGFITVTDDKENPIRISYKFNLYIFITKIDGHPIFGLLSRALLSSEEIDKYCFRKSRSLPCIRYP